MNERYLKPRLILMNFLQFAVWGAWLISLGAYLGGPLSFSGVEIGSFYATMGIAALFMPALMGIIADKWIPAQYLLGLCHLVAGGLMIAAAPRTDYSGLYTLVLLSVCFYMPTLALANSVAYYALTKNGMDTVKEFPPIRVWGTVGFICAMLAVDWLGFKTDNRQLYLSGGLSILLALYCLTLPKSPIHKSASVQGWIERLGLSAFSLFKQRHMAIFFLFSMLLGVSLQITNGFANDYLTNYFGNIPEYADTFGVKNSGTLIALSQISETLCILLIPFALKRYGIKNVMLISMFAWVLRFGLLGTGDPGSGVWMLVLSMIVYGVAFDFFNISGSLYVDRHTHPKIRSSAQGVFLIMTNGFGSLIGSYVAGYVVEVYGYPKSWFVFAGYALVVAILFFLVFHYKNDMNEPVKQEI